MINVDSERSAGGCAKWWRECVCEKDRAWQRETEQKEQKEGEQERGRESKSELCVCRGWGMLEEIKRG